jgi:RHS repeat-associated protein
MYHVTSVASWYSGGSQVSPFAAEIASGSRRPVPLKDVATRVRTQQFVYDFLGNTEYTVDDLGLRYDRSLGNITNAGDSTSKKNQLVAADGIAAKYDEAGNLVDLRVERPGTRCDPDLCAQRFVYEWDEVGQLSRARRWDYFQTIPATEPEYPAVPTSAPAADLHFAYHLGQRILKTREVAGEDQLHTVEVYDSLRLNDTTYDTETNDYGRDPPQATVYLAGMGRVVRDPYLPTSTGNMTHVFLNVGDHLGSVGMVIDGETSELVEKTTHQPYGALESDYRPTRWRSFREDYKFTGKEEDIEVGIQYFGARYYAPRLGRWMSADPLTIHGLGADLNPYAYVGGRVLSSRDPWGLTEEAEPQPQPQPPQAWGACELCPTEEVTVHGDRYERYIREESYARIDATRPGGADVVTPVLLGIGQAYLNFSNGVAEKLYGLDKYRTALESWRNGRARANPRAVPAAIIRGTPLLPNTVADKIDPHDKDDVLGPAVEHVYGNAQDAIAIFGLAGPMAIGGVARAGALAGEIGAAGGGGGRTVALGLSGPRGTWLARFAERVGGTTWKEWGGANWRQGFMEVMADPGTKAHFNLTGISPSPLGAAARGATPLGGATEWELSMIRNNSQWWSRITWWAEGKPVANPFGP